jgi:hypothetical protein
VRFRLAILVAVGSVALAVAAEALADPSQLAPADDASFTARVDDITFQASTAVTPAPDRMNFYVSRSDEAPSGTLANPIDTFFAGPNASVPPVYQKVPGDDTNWPNRPGTYYWQARYDNCAVADPNCFSPIRSLTLEPLAPPTQTSPADETTIPYGHRPTFSIQDVPSYRRGSSQIYLEFARNAALSPDGTFADRYQLTRPSAVGGGAYEVRMPDTIAERPGTYYWIVERFDCSAEPASANDCYVTDGEIRSFAVANPPAGRTPNTNLVRHPPRRTRKRRARFAFRSTIQSGYFQCHYTGGWKGCQSPLKFRRLRPGRYRFKVRAVANGRKDPTPASWLFKVVRRKRG